MSLEDDFAVFVKAHSGRLLRAAWLLTGQWPSAEDLVQTALERTWPRWGKLATDERRLAYLRKVVTTSFLRDRKRRWHRELSTLDLPEPARTHGGWEGERSVKSTTSRALSALRKRPDVAELSC